MANFEIENRSITPREFVNGCEKKEIRELIKILQENGHLGHYVADASPVRPNLNDLMYWENLNVLSNNRLRLSKEEEDFIETLAKKYK